MKKRDWRELSGAAFAAEKFLCVGLDPVHAKIPERYQDDQDEDLIPEMEDFCVDVIDAVGAIAGFLKPNWAFFLQYGPRGLNALLQLIRYAQKTYPELVIILDCKVGDIGDTNVAYARFFFKQLGADAITMHGYLGQQANQPFLDYADKGFFILCHTSNPGAEEFQHLETSSLSLYERVALHVSNNWNMHGNCGLVAGATYPDAVEEIRKLAPTLPLLVPGIGKQGGDLQAAVSAAKDWSNAGFIINSSSGIIFADDPQAAAKELHEEILTARK